MTWGCPEGAKCWKSLANHSSLKEAVLKGDLRGTSLCMQNTNKDHLHQLLYSLMRERSCHRADFSSAPQSQKESLIGPQKSINEHELGDPERSSDRALVYHH